MEKGIMEETVNLKVANLEEKAKAVEELKDEEVEVLFDQIISRKKTLNESIIRLQPLERNLKT